MVAKAVFIVRIAHSYSKCDAADVGDSDGLRTATTSFKIVFSGSKVFF